jgi:putative glycosyltransferase (TIGR04372 family)
MIGAARLVRAAPYWLAYRARGITEVDVVNTQFFGHLIGEPLLILRNATPGSRRPRVTPHPHKSNPAMWRIWTSRLHSTPAPFLAFDFERKLAGWRGRAPRIALKNNGDQTHAAVSEAGDQLPSCPPGLLSQADRTLSRLAPSTSGEAPLICYMNRSDAFRKFNEGPELHSYRNAFVAPLETALLRNGLGRRLVRIGKAEDPSFDPPGERDERFIDYASSDRRSPEADVALLYACDAYVGADSGPAWLPLARRAPVAFTDMVPLGMASPTSPELMLVIPRLIFSVELGRLLTLAEMLSASVREARSTEAYTALGLELVPNAVEDIEALLDDFVCLHPRLAGSTVAATGFDRELGDHVQRVCVRHTGQAEMPYISPRFIAAHRDALVL